MANETTLKDILELRSDILAVSTVLNGNQSEFQIKSDALPPTEEDLGRMMLQVELFGSMIATNEKVAGNTRFFLISHDNLNVIIAPVAGRKSLVVVFTLFREIESLIEQVLKKATLIT